VSDYVEKNEIFPKNEIEDLLTYIDGIRRLTASIGQELDRTFINKFFASLIQADSLEEISIKFETEYQLTVFLPPNLPLISSRALSILNSIKKIATVKRSSPSREMIISEEGDLSRISIHIITKEALPTVKDFISSFNFIESYEIQEFDTEEEFKRVREESKDKIISTGFSLTDIQMQRMNGLLAELFRLENIISKVDMSELSKNERYMIGNFRDNIFEMQEIVNDIRLIPINNILTSLRRHVRSTSEKMGKEVDFFVSGENVRFERNIADGLMDPLIVLINNALAHGIEDVQERENLGKSPKGMIRIQAIAADNNTILRIFDNGRGIDFEHIWKIAQERGLVEGAFNDNEARLLLFRPSFSTASDVSTVAGRGMGLVQVRDFVTKFNGKINVSSNPGQNTTFELSFPIQNSIAPVVTVEINGQEYGFPENQIENIVRLMDGESLGQDKLVQFDTRFGRIKTLNLPVIFAKKGDPIISDEGAIIVWNNGIERVGFYVNDIFSFQELSINYNDPINTISPYFNGSVVKANGEQIFLLQPTAFQSLENL
jgi:two-component system chemotaxis sensor kinase CheA